MRATTLLHASRAALEAGTVLSARPDPGLVDADVEEVLEANRPQGRPARAGAVYMMRDRRTVRDVGRDEAHLYEVAALGVVHRLDHLWVNDIWRLFAEHEDGTEERAVVLEAGRLARAYWSGEPRPLRDPGDRAIWEYLAARARVVRRAA